MVKYTFLFWRFYIKYLLHLPLRSNSFWEICGWYPTQCCSTIGWFVGCSAGSTMPQGSGREDSCGQNANDSVCSFPKTWGLTSVNTEDNEQEIFYSVVWAQHRCRKKGTADPAAPFSITATPKISSSLLKKNMSVKWKTNGKKILNHFSGCWLGAKMVFPRLL